MIFYAFGSVILHLSSTEILRASAMMFWILINGSLILYKFREDFHSISLFLIFSFWVGIFLHYALFFIGLHFISEDMSAGQIVIFINLITLLLSIYIISTQWKNLISLIVTKTITLPTANNNKNVVLLFVAAILISTIAYSGKAEKFIENEYTTIGHWVDQPDFAMHFVRNISDINEGLPLDKIKHIGNQVISSYVSYTTFGHISVASSLIIFKFISVLMIFSIIYSLYAILLEYYGMSSIQALFISSTVLFLAPLSIDILTFAISSHRESLGNWAYIFHSDTFLSSLVYLLLSMYFIERFIRNECLNYLILASVAISIFIFL